MATFTGTAGNNVIHGTAGADIIKGLGGDDDLYGHGGNDLIEGGDRSDDLFGGAGNDTLYGGMGADDYLGGGGADTFLFKASDVPSGGAVDVIRDFSKAEHDHIDLQGFNNGTLVYNQQNGSFAYDFAGDGHGPVEFMHVDPGKSLALGHDYFIT